MAQSDTLARMSASSPDNPAIQSHSLWKRLFHIGRDKDNAGFSAEPATIDDAGRDTEQDDGTKPGLIRRVSRKVVPGLPRVQTFKRQQSELRDRLEPVKPTPAERRAVSADRRLQPTISHTASDPRVSAPDFLPNYSFSAPQSVISVTSAQGPASPDMIEEKAMLGIYGEANAPDIAVPREGFSTADVLSNQDAHSITTTAYEAMINDELERIWILNLSMHFRDKSKREKFFVTYRENNSHWRRVTISLDYRNAPEGSLEMELVGIKFQRDKSAKIYEAIRESLVDIQFYDTVTNLKLETTNGRLHVHVVEDANETIHYPNVQMVQHMNCRRVKEKDLHFESHMSGFVYKVSVDNEVLIKKEIPAADTVDEFMYEINALSRLRTAENVIRFYGVVVDNDDRHVKGLLISFAKQGALIDIIYDNNHSMPWSTREVWARQIVAGLSEIHESGFVQGDFTLSNIVIDEHGDAKIIDINRRGCPVGWEPPEATPLIESNQRISMYIGVKSDLYQLGMVLWALATQEDEPEAHGRPLRIETDADVPIWYRRIVDICLSEDPRYRKQALQLLSMFPEPEPTVSSPGSHSSLPVISVDDGYVAKEYFVEAGTGAPQIRTVQPPGDYSYVPWDYPYSPNRPTDDPYYYPVRGRSPPSPLPSDHEGYVPRYSHIKPSWSDYGNDALTAPSVSDVPPEIEDDETPDVSPGYNLARGPATFEYVSQGQGVMEPRSAGELNVEKEAGEEAERVDELETPRDAGSSKSVIRAMVSDRPLKSEHSAHQADTMIGGNEGDLPLSTTKTEEEGSGDDEINVQQGKTAPEMPSPIRKADEPNPTEIRDTVLTTQPVDQPSEELSEKNVAGVQSPEATKDEVLEWMPPRGKEEQDAGRGLELGAVQVPMSTGPKGLEKEIPELTGVGSAYDLASQRRQDNIREEDFGLPVASQLAKEDSAFHAAANDAT